MTRLETDAEVLKWPEARLQTEVMGLAADHGWHVPTKARRELEQQLAALKLPPDPLPCLVYHDRVAYRSEPGWPDLVMVRRRDRRLIFAELKRESKAPTARQELVLDLLRCLEHAGNPHPEFMHDADRMPFDMRPRIQVFVWRPSDLLSGSIEEVLR